MVANSPSISNSQSVYSCGMLNPACSLTQQSIVRLSVDITAWGKITGGAYSYNSAINHQRSSRVPSVCCTRDTPQLSCGTTIGIN